MRSGESGEGKLVGLGSRESGEGKLVGLGSRESGEGKLVGLGRLNVKREIIFSWRGGRFGR